MAKAKTMECEYKGVGIGKDISRISISVAREKLSLKQADDLFVGSQIDAVMSCDPGNNGDAAGQQTMEGCSLDLNVVADCHGFRTDSERYSASLSINKKAVDLATLAQFANRKGTITATRMGAATGKPEPEEENGEND